MKNQITINLEDSNGVLNCNINTENPISAEELIFTLSSLMEMFSHDTNIHPIQLSTVLQNTIVERMFAPKETNIQDSHE